MRVLGWLAADVEVGNPVLRGLRVVHAHVYVRFCVRRARKCWLGGWRDRVRFGSAVVDESVDRVEDRGVHAPIPVMAVEREPVRNE